LHSVYDAEQTGDVVGLLCRGSSLKCAFFELVELIVHNSVKEGGHKDLGIPQAEALRLAEDDVAGPSVPGLPGISGWFAG